MNIGFDEGFFNKNGINSSVHCLKEKHNTAGLISPPHYHKYAEILFGIDGDINVWANDVSFKIKSGDMCLIRPNETHSIYSTRKECEYFVIKFLPELLLSAGIGAGEAAYTLPITVNMAGSPPIVMEKTPETGKISEIIHNIISDWENEALGYEFAVKGGILYLFAEIVRIKQFEKLPPGGNVLPEVAARICAVAEAAQKNCAFISEEAAAEECNMSYSYFSRSFKKVIGRSFTEFVAAARLDCAKKMLLTQNLTVTTIAARLGYCSTSHFIAAFKRDTGISPLKYRKNNTLPQ